MRSLLKENDVVYKALAILAVEKTLLNIGKQIYDQVIDVLNKKYHCYLIDCYEHPEYLSEIFKELYGNYQNVMIELIKKELEEFSYREPIERFLKVISQ